MDLNDLGLYHVVVGDVHGRSELSRPDVVHYPHEQLVLHPVVEPAASGVVVPARQPPELQLLHPVPRPLQLLHLQETPDPILVLQPFKEGSVVEVREVGVHRHPVLLFLKHPLVLLRPLHFLHKAVVGPLLPLGPEVFELLDTQERLFELPLKGGPPLAQVKGSIEV